MTRLLAVITGPGVSGWCSTPGAAQGCERAAAALLTASQTRASPPVATGRFVARPFVREDTLLVAAAGEPSDAEQPPPTVAEAGAPEGGSGCTGRHGVGQVWASSARKAVGV